MRITGYSRNNITTPNAGIRIIVLLFLSVKACLCIAVGFNQYLWAEGTVTFKASIVKLVSPTISRVKISDDARKELAMHDAVYEEDGSLFIRLFGIAEREELTAKDKASLMKYLQANMSKRSLTITCYGSDPFNRPLCDITLGSVSLGEWLLKNQFAQYIQTFGKHPVLDSKFSKYISTGP